MRQSHLWAALHMGDPQSTAHTFSGQGPVMHPTWGQASQNHSLAGCSIRHGYSRVLTGSPQPSSPSSPQVSRRHGALTMVGWGGVSNVAISSHHPHPHSPSQRPLVLGPAVLQKGLTCTNLHQTYAPFSVSLASPSWEDQGEGNSWPRVQLDRSAHANG